MNNVENFVANVGIAHKMSAVESAESVCMWEGVTLIFFIADIFIKSPVCLYRRMGERS